ncbi:hypothetical protein Q0601_22480 [Paracoccus onubensis]|nr:hypothetical protein [Paracoccus onubensis]MDP0929956.1 hypothetical protein [Paracoccus onubensis]
MTAEAIHIPARDTLADTKLQSVLLLLPRMGGLIVFDIVADCFQ